VQRFNEFLNFKDDVWNSTYGIHARGAGFYVRSSTGSTFARWSTTNEGQVITNIYGTLDDEYYDYGRQLYLHGLNAATATKSDTIDAVENIIVDELALETSFEGNRFTDLVRIAEHKNASGRQGTQWLATKIANRGSRRATSTLPAVERRGVPVRNTPSLHYCHLGAATKTPRWYCNNTTVTQRKYHGDTATTPR